MSDGVKSLIVGDLVFVGRHGSIRLSQIGMVVKVTKTTIIVRHRCTGAETNEQVYEQTFSMAHGYAPGHQYYGDRISPFEVEQAVEMMEAIIFHEADQFLKNAAYTSEETLLLANVLRQHRATKKDLQEA